MTTEAQPMIAPAEPDRRNFTGVVESRVLRTFLDTIKPLNDEVKLKLTDEGWTVATVDPAHVSMVAVELSKQSFISYHRDGMSEVLLDVDLARKLFSAVKGSMTEVRVSLKPATNGPGSNIELEWEVKGDRFSVSHRLGDPSKKFDPLIPNLALPTSFTMGRGQLEDLSRAFKKVGLEEYLTICCEGGQIAFEQNGESGKMKQLARVESLVAGENCRSIFAVDYWEAMLRSLRAVDKLNIHLGNDYPIQVEGEKDGLRLNFYIAPRIVSD